MVLAEIKNAVDALSPEELAELAAFMREHDNPAWDQQINSDFAYGGRLRAVLDKVDADIRAGRLEETCRDRQSASALLETFRFAFAIDQKLAREEYALWKRGTLARAPDEDSWPVN